MNLPHANPGVPYSIYTELKFHIDKCIMSNWQDEWNSAGANKLYSVKPVLSLFVVLCPINIYGLSGWVPTCDSVHSWELYSAASLEHQAAGTMTCYPIESHYPDTELTSPCPILIMPSARLGSDKYQFGSTRGTLG